MLAVLAWTLYNLAVLAFGVWSLKHSRVRGLRGEGFIGVAGLPFFSIVVPVKNEEKVVGRLLDGLLRLNYPRERFEVVVVEDGSSDGTVDVCLKYVEKSGGLVRLVRKPFSEGKPSALNFGVRFARGDVVGFFDADSVPEADVLLRASGYFADLGVAAVQGRVLSINAGENMLTRFVSYEDAVWCEAYLRGKDVLGLFVHLRGSCMFVRRDVLEMLGGFDEKALSEDMVFSARLVEKACRVRYASDVRAWQENPSSLSQLFRQRLRWFRGTMDAAFRFGRLVKRFDRAAFDAEATLAGPFILAASLFSYAVSVYGLFACFPVDLAVAALLQFVAFAATALFFICGLALVYVSRPWRLANLLWLPFLYFYWSLQCFIAFYAFLLNVFRRRRSWVKTEKSGRVTVDVYCGEVLC